MSNVKSMLHHNRVRLPIPITDIAIKIFVWTVFALIFINTLYFVIRTSSPVIQQDAWYFFDVFLKKAIQGNLTLGDFFVRRDGADHSQPLFKIEMLIEWRFFNLDFSVGAVIGVLAAVACSLILYRITVMPSSTGKTRLYRGLAWLCMSALFLSLNADGATWTWPLVALENVTTLIIILFMTAVWWAHKYGRYFGLAFFTLLLGITSDDSAILAVIATLAALALMHVRNLNKPRSSDWKIFIVVVLIITFIRIGYLYAPIKGGDPAPSMLSNMGSLIHSFCNGGWWMWLVMPLALPVAYKSPSIAVSHDAWTALQIAISAALLVAHIFFWRKAFRTGYTAATFLAVCLMLLSYGWVAGIILGRVPLLGNGYLNQPRYIALYAYHLIALLIMWGDSLSAEPGLATKSNFAATVLPAVGCFLILALQIPMSINSWHRRPYQSAYDAAMAIQIEQIAMHPSIEIKCLPEQYLLCGWSPRQRQELIEMLRSGRLNIFSPRVQQRHRYLPKFQ